jgi:ABC-type polysaccharide/polyol phosphate transport system ATPase subunit
MSDIAIRVENLSKKYSIGETIRQDTLRDALAHALPRIARISRRNGNSSNSSNSRQESSSEFWALKDVSFEVKRGEVVGVIGRNGAGKSTLLKVLSRITEPTSGVAEIHGRVGSLLEVGTGFHPELTGRENIYLNGAILGMKRVEIDRKFDEIVAFAEIEKFLDTPVKRYSSGMYVRLAFAVAAHLEPEILLVDEVLAVGDAAFQKKCLGKMGDVAKEGRTVLFVSHNMGAIRTLCERGVYISDAKITFDGDSIEAIAQYLEDNALLTEVQPIRLPLESACGSLRLITMNVGINKKDIFIAIQIEALKPLPLIGLGFEIRGVREELVTSQGAIHSGAYVQEALGKYELTLKLSDIVSNLNGGKYWLSIWLARPGGDKYIEIRNVSAIHVPMALPDFGQRILTSDKNGPLYVDCHFEVKHLAQE